MNKRFLVGTMMLLGLVYSPGRAIGGAKSRPVPVPSASVSSTLTHPPSPKTGSPNGNPFAPRKRSQFPTSGAGSIVGKCPENNCPAGQECVEIEVHCAVAPCPPMRDCALRD